MSLLMIIILIIAFRTGPIERALATLGKLGGHSTLAQLSFRMELLFPSGKDPLEEYHDLPPLSADYPYGPAT